MALIVRLLWDERNEEHIGRHGVDREDVEEAVHNRPHITRNRHDTYRVVGQTDAGRYLTIIVSPRGHGEFYVVTARDADLVERRVLRRR